MLPGWGGPQSVLSLKKKNSQIGDSEIFSLSLMSVEPSPMLSKLSTYLEKSFVDICLCKFIKTACFRFWSFPFWESSWLRKEQWLKNVGTSKRCLSVNGVSSVRIVFSKTPKWKIFQVGRHKMFMVMINMCKAQIATKILFENVLKSFENPTPWHTRVRLNHVSLAT